MASARDPTASVLSTHIGGSQRPTLLAATGCSAINGGAAVLALQGAAYRIAEARQKEADQAADYAEDRGQQVWWDVDVPRPRNRKPRVAWGLLRCVTPLRRKIAAASPTPMLPSETQVSSVAATHALLTKTRPMKVDTIGANDNRNVERPHIERPELRLCTPPPLPIAPPPLPCTKIRKPRPPPLPVVTCLWPPPLSLLAESRGRDLGTSSSQKVRLFSNETFRWPTQADSWASNEHGNSLQVLKEPATNPVRLHQFFSSSWFAQ
eukprot:COSAG05_NODE_3747_length_1863_cov_1.930272_2_plen_265_part_00